MWHLELNGRVRISFVNAILKGGLFIISIYLWHSEGLSERNLSLLNHLARVLASLRAPWLIAGDWNMVPALLCKSGWLSLIKGDIHATGASTCNLQEYDYYVLDARLSPAVVAVKSISGSSNSPHVPTRLYLRGNARSLMVKAIVSPMKIPAFLPAGCLPQYAGSGWDSIASEESPDTFTAPGLECALGAWFDRTASLLVDVMALDVGQAAKFFGRSSGTKVVTRPGLGKPGTADPKFSMVTVAWRCCKNWLADLIRGQKHVYPSPHKARALKARWHLLHHDWTRAGTSKHAEALRAWHSRLTTQLLEDAGTYSYLHWTVSIIAGRAEKYDIKQSEVAFQNWLTEGTARVTSTMHFMTRVQGGWIPSCYKPDSDGEVELTDDAPGLATLSASGDDECA
jgi:hypothetical protein